MRFSLGLVKPKPWVGVLQLAFTQAPKYDISVKPLGGAIDLGDLPWLSGQLEAASVLCVLHLMALLAVCDRGGGEEAHRAPECGLAAL